MYAATLGVFGSRLPPQLTNVFPTLLTDGVNAAKAPMVAFMYSRIDLSLKAVLVILEADFLLLTSKADMLPAMNAYLGIPITQADIVNAAVESVEDINTGMRYFYIETVPGSILWQGALRIEYKPIPKSGESSLIFTYPQSNDPNLLFI